MKYIVSWSHDLMSENWNEEECDTIEEAETLTKKRKKQGFVVLPPEEVEETDVKANGFVVSFANDATSLNWDIQHFCTKEDAEAFSEQRRKDGYTVSPIITEDEYSVETECSKLRTTITFLESENTRLQQKNKDVGEKAVTAINQLRTENEQLNSRLEKAKSIYSSQKQQIEELNARLEKAKEVYFAMKAEIKALKQQLEQKQ